MKLINPFLNTKPNFDLWKFFFISNGFELTENLNSIIFYKYSYPRILLTYNKIEIVEYSRAFNLEDSVLFFKEINNLIFGHLKKTHRKKYDFSFLDKYKGNYIYVVGSELFPFVKIGRTSDIKKRLNTLQTSSPYVLNVLFLITDNYLILEKQIHERLQDYRLGGEWFDNSVKEMLIKMYSDNIIIINNE